jgi:hypothetical protein
MKTMSEFKASQKQLAATIKNLKSTRKEQPNGFVFGLAANKAEYRARHIVYCLLRGRSIEQIENHRAKKTVDHTSYTEYVLRKDVASIWTEMTGNALLDALDRLETASELASNYLYVVRASHAEAVRPSA